MTKFLEKIFYCLGINFSGYDIDLEVEYLKKNIPNSYRKRNVTDIGGGDGEVSLKLMPVLKPTSFLLVDMYESFVKAARKRGLKAKKVDVEKQRLQGDLGILWGVVHHFDDPVAALKKLKKNFKHLLIRECVDEGRIFEIGHRLTEEKIVAMLENAGWKVKKLIVVPEHKSRIFFVE